MPSQTPGSILSQAQQSLTLAQRAMYDRLRASGIADAVARQLAIAIAKSSKPETVAIAKRAAHALAGEALQAVRISKASYHQAFVEEAKAMLPSDLVDRIHTKARARAGGHASGEARRQQAADNDDLDMQGTGEVLKAEGTVPPKGVQAACRRGLELAPEYGGDGLTDGAKARARSMADGGAVSAENIRRMKAFFARHDNYAKESSPPSPGYVAWLLWGGDAGKSWAESQADKLEKGQAPLGAAFSHARASGKKQDKESRKRRAQKWLRDNDKPLMSTQKSAGAALAKMALGACAKSSPVASEVRVDELANQQQPPKKKKKPAEQVSKSHLTRLVKAEETPWKRLVTSVVYEPDVADTDGDFMDAETIEKACHNFMREGGYINVEHAGEPVAAQVVENWIAPATIRFGEGDEPHFTVTKGTWLQTVAVDDHDLWQGVVDGTFSGFSLEGTALREEPALA